MLELIFIFYNLLNFKKIFISFVLIRADMRLFTAVEFKKENNQIKEIVNKIKNMLLVKNKDSRARFLDNFHITLLFLGEIENKKAETISKALESVKIRETKLKIRKIGFFCSGKKARVLFLDVEDNKELKAMQKEVSETIARLNKRKEIKTKKSKGFKAHITIARVKKDCGLKEAIAKINKELGMEIKNIKLGVVGFSLIESVLTNKGAIYKTLKEYRK